MTVEPTPYAVPLEALEAAVRVTWDAQVETVDAAGVRDLDPGPPQPDRGWAAASG